MGFKFNNDFSDHHQWSKAAVDLEEDKTGRFMTLSLSFHALAFIASAFITVPLIEKAQQETIVIEINETEPPKPIVQKVQKLEPVIKPIPKGEITPKVQGSKAPVAKAPKVAAQSKAATVTAPQAPKLAALPTVPSGLDDFDTSDLDSAAQSLTANKASAAAFDDSDIDASDAASSAALAAHASAMDEEIAALAEESDIAVQKSKSRNAEHSKAMAALAAARRAQDEEAIAQALAAERAAAARAAQAAREAAAARAAEQARFAAAAQAAEAEAKRKAALARAAQGPAGSGGGGQGGTGFGAGTSPSGSPNGMRNIDQLRQKPGNPIPKYSNDERLRREQGEAVVVAYVTKAGALDKLQMVKSTGYGTLDAKTVAALRQWKFYPGQEGWVEIPFRWDLKGGVQEAGGLLRRRSAVQ